MKRKESKNKLILLQIENIHFTSNGKQTQKKIKKMESRFSDLIESSKISSENHDLFDCIGNQSKNGKFIFFLNFFKE
jgi:hypothetical protein